MHADPDRRGTHPRPVRATPRAEEFDAPSTRPTWAEIDLGALRSNLRRARQRAAGRRVIAVVKADGYGHGAARVARALEREGADAFAVATFEEARELRRVGGVTRPVLLLEGLHRAQDTPEAIALGLTAVVHRADMLEALDRAAASASARLPVHLKIDTGMARLGMAPEELGAVLDRTAACTRLDLRGLLTHLAESDDARSPVTAVQRTRFVEVVSAARARGVEPEWIHADPSAGLLRGPTPTTTAVRPGIMLYGVDPTLERSTRLDPVMTLRCRVIQVADVPAGTRVGYGGTYTTPRATRLLTLPVGYADGLPRAAGGRAHVFVEGRRAGLVGRVSMDLATVDAGPGSSARVGSVVTCFGRTEGGVLPVEDLAESVDTIGYEILTRVGARVPRVPPGTAIRSPS